MASPLAASSSRDAGGAPPPVAPHASPNAGAPVAGAPVDTAQLDRLVEKALTAYKSGRYLLAAGFYRRAADEALLLPGNTFVCTFLTLWRASPLWVQSQLDGVTPDERMALYDEAWALVSSVLPLLVRRMDANTMLPGRGTAVELAFFKRYESKRNTIYNEPPLSTRALQLIGLSFGYATAVFAANRLLILVIFRRNIEAEVVILRVVDCMLPAAQSLASMRLVEEVNFASSIQQVRSGAFRTIDATFIASLRAKWTAAAMVQMRRERNLLDVSEMIKNLSEAEKTRWRADVVEHG